MNFLDRAIGIISPKWAYERAVYKEAVRSYEAGQIDRFSDMWTPINMDTENADKVQRDLIKARARSLENNSDMAESAIGSIVRNSVGTGISPQARTPDDKINKTLESLWKTWTKQENCDITGQQTFYEIQAMLLRRKVVDGESLVRKVYDKKARIPLKLQVIKPDLLDSYLLTAPKTNRIIRSGIELDDYLKPVAYWIQRKSPDGYITYQSDRVPADQILHLWNKKHSDQIRGISELATSIKRIKDTDDYMTAETIAAKIAACFSIFVTKNMPTSGPVPGRTAKDKEGKPLESIRPGMIAHLRPGETITTANPSRSITSAKDFVKVQQQLCGAGLGLSYELVSRDFSNANFSSARQGHLEDRRTFLPIQGYMIAHCCLPIWEAFVEAVVLAGLVKIPDYWTNKETYTASDWITPGWEWIDPQKEANADVTLMKNGGMTLAQWCAGRGYDWETQLKEMAKEKKYAESLGLDLTIHKPESVQAAEMNHKGVQNEE
ncbi:lambda family phage portal protein [Sporomusaceae bacterium BoRhaA]|uniref:phage portal protein n=1 Tax=Pelorhabdus rhamnosifermentans TaxID=2772457 RepID=UPI001C06016B|nr:phage portal protein [Pelorhabdus rhamnosifermentans]MBU2701679.1 lambda family phage portal protein [Pelorhabdus rhamnosifermentans]